MQPSLHCFSRFLAALHKVLVQYHPSSVLLLYRTVKEEMETITSSSSPADVVTLISEVLRSISLELTIFLVTLGFALIIRRGGPSHAVGRVHKKMDQFSEPPPLKAPPSRATWTPCGPAQVSQRVPTGPTVLTSRRPSLCTDGAYAHAPWQLMQEAASTIREQNSMKSACRALALYEELRVQVLEGSLNIVEVAAQAKLSCTDFFTMLVHCAVRSGRHQMLESILDFMTAQGVARTMAFYESAMKQLAGQKQFALALAVYDRLVVDGLQPSAVTCSCLIGFAAEVGELSRAISFFERLSAISTPTIRAYMTILRVHLKRQDWTSSVKILKDMKCRGVQPDSLALNVVLATGVAADRMDLVSELVEEAERDTPPISDVVSYNTLVKGYAQRGDADGALKVLERLRMRGLRPNSITFNTCMDAFVRAHRSEEPWRLLKEMRAEGLRPDKFTCSILIKGLARSPTAEGVSGALKLLEEASSSCDSSLRSSLYHTVLHAAHSLPNGDLLRKAFAQMRKYNVSPTAAAQKLIMQALPHEDPQ